MKNPFKAKNETTSIDAMKASPEEKITVEKNRIQDSLDEYERLDGEAREFYRGFVPPIKTTTHKKHKIIGLGDQEFNASYVTDIQVTNTGTPPHCGSDLKIMSYEYYARAALQGCVTVYLVSGREITFTCNRHAVEAVFLGLREAWQKALD